MLVAWLATKIHDRNAALHLHLLPLVHLLVRGMALTTNAIVHK
jgi:hypothetical protein